MTENDWEEEEILVYVDFESRVEDNLIDPNKEFKLIGLDSDNPVLQLSDQVYSGKWKDSLGTQVILEEDENPVRTDPLFTETPETYLKYKCKTDKVLHMSRIFVHSKNQNKTDPAKESNSTSSVK